MLLWRSLPSWFLFLLGLLLPKVFTKHVIKFGGCGFPIVASSWFPAVYILKALNVAFW